MKNKIHVLGSNYQSILLEYIAPEELPAYIGGSKTDPDGNPRCETMVSHYKYEKLLNSIRYNSEQGM